MNPVAYLGEQTGDNMQVSPEQLLDMIRRDLTETENHPVMGLVAIVVRERPDGSLELDNYRCRLPRFVETVVVLRRALGVLGVPTDG